MSFLIPSVPVSCGCLLFDEAGRLLVLKPTYKKGWTIPGGIMEDDGETPWDGCRREVREETGLEVTAGRLVAVDTRPSKADGRIGLRFLFRAVHPLTAADVAAIGLQEWSDLLSPYGAILGIKVVALVGLGLGMALAPVNDAALADALDRPAVEELPEDRRTAGIDRHEHAQLPGDDLVEEAVGRKAIAHRVGEAGQLDALGPLVVEAGQPGGLRVVGGQLLQHRCRCGHLRGLPALGARA